MYCGLVYHCVPNRMHCDDQPYDKTVFELSRPGTYEFSDMSPEFAAEKRELLEKHNAEKQAAKLAAMKAKEGGA
jgi:NADH-quinone oxidoreductase subunit I